MWSTRLASLKENLNKISQDVHDDDDDYEDSSIYNSNDRNDSPVPNRRFSDRSFSYSNSPVSNGFDSAHNSEVYTYTKLSYICFYLFVFRIMFAENVMCVNSSFCLKLIWLYF